MTGYSASPLYLQHLDSYSRKKQFFILSSLSHPLPAFLSAAAAPPSLASPAEWQTCLFRQDKLATVARWIHTVLFTHSEAVAALMPQSSGFSRPFPLYNAAPAAVVSTSPNGEFTLSSGADASRLNIFDSLTASFPPAAARFPFLTLDYLIAPQTGTTEILPSASRPFQSIDAVLKVATPVISIISYRSFWVCSIRSSP